MKEGDKFKRRNTLTIGLISGSISSQGPAFKGKGSYFISLRRMWLDFANASRVWENSFYLENPVSLNKLNFNAGIRLAGFFLKNKTYIYPEPRFSASLELFRNIRLKTSYAEMHQLVHMFENQVAGFGTEFFFPSTATISPSSSRITTIGLEKETGDYQVGIDFYTKKMGNLVSMKEGESFQGNAIDWQERVEQGTGKSLLLFLQRAETLAGRPDHRALPGQLFADHPFCELYHKILDFLRVTRLQSIIRFV